MKPEYFSTIMVAGLALVGFMAVFRNETLLALTAGWATGVWTMDLIEKWMNRHE
jgi:hypothetical protein